jgi:hypothetical protein
MTRKIKIDVQEKGLEFTFWVWARHSDTAWQHVCSGIRMTHESALEAARERANLWLEDGV